MMSFNLILQLSKIQGHHSSPPIFQVPPCPKCEGPLIPELTFFGDNVAKGIVDQVYQKVEEADALFVVGSSLYVSICIFFYSIIQSTNG